MWTPGRHERGVNVIRFQLQTNVDAAADTGPATVADDDYDDDYATASIAPKATDAVVGTAATNAVADVGADAGSAAALRELFRKLCKIKMGNI